MPPEIRRLLVRLTDFLACVPEDDGLQRDGFEIRDALEAALLALPAERPRIHESMGLSENLIVLPADRPPPEAEKDEDLSRVAPGATSPSAGTTAKSTTGDK
jgi:hypothetical protein